MKLDKILLIGCLLLGMQTTVRAERSYEKLCAGYEKACENGKCGLFINGHHSPIVYNDVRCAQDTNAILVSTQPGKWHIYNEDKQTAGPGQYDEVQAFDMYRLKVKTTNKWGLVTTEGTELLPAKYEDVTVLSNNYLMAKNSGKWKIFYSQGQEIKEISPTAYERVEPAPKYYKGYYMVTVNGKKGLIFLPHPWMEERVNLSYVKPLYDDIVLPPYYNFVKVSQNKKWGLYDLKSGELVSRLFDDISRFGPSHQDMFKTTLQGKHGVLTINNTQTLEEIVPPTFEDVKALVGKQLIAISQKGKWGVYDTKEQKVILDPVYKDIRPSGVKAVQVLEQGEWTKKQLL